MEESKKKNILIGGLLAIVLVMAVGYAAFATTLNISGSASISSSWNVHFDTTKTSGTGVVATTGTATGGTISYSDGQHATISSTGLVAPGDSATYTLTILNTGSLPATLGAITLSGTSCTVSGLTCTSTSGNIKFTVTNPSPTALPATSGSATMTVKAEYVDQDVTEATSETASIQITFTASQSS
ncbi:MAG: hypothetical protein IKE75_00565 [Bacilli bacterium]|nr:hypothetical protein [Bacilli bacterium]